MGAWRRDANDPGGGRVAGERVEDLLRWFDPVLLEDLANDFPFVS